MGLVSRILNWKKKKIERRKTVPEIAPPNESVEIVKPKSKSLTRSSRYPLRMSLCGYKGITEIDDLSPDGCILDFTYISEENFLLIILLTDLGDLQIFYQIGTDRARRRNVSIRSICGRGYDPVAIALGPEAAFVVLALLDGDILVLPIKLVMEVPWSGGQYFSEPVPVVISVPRAAEECLSTPTSIVCHNTIHAARPVAIMSNKAGQILIVDLSIRKLTIEMQAPQSVHSIEVIDTGTEASLLVTGCTSAQWLVPLENAEQSLREVLSKLVPSDLKQIEPVGSTLFHIADGVAVLNPTENTVEIFQSLANVGGIPSKRLKIPPETWLLHYTKKVLFTVSKQADFRFFPHFGLPIVRPEFTKIVPESSWRILGFVPVSVPGPSMPHCYVINERGMVRVQPDNAGKVDIFVAEYLFRATIFSRSLCEQVASTSGLEPETVQKTLIPSILLLRKGTRFDPFELQKVISMSRTLQTDMERLLELFAKNGIDDQLLPEVMRTIDSDRKSTLRKHVVDLYVKRLERENSPAARNKTDLELSLWLTRHSDITAPLASVCKGGLWRSASLLSNRSKSSQLELLSFLLEHGPKLIANEDEVMQQIITCALSIKWDWLDVQSSQKLVNLLIGWEKSHAHHEMCLRIAVQHSDSFPEACSLLYIVSAMYLLSDGCYETQVIACPAQPISCGLNCSVVCGVDDRITMFGEMGALQHKMEQEDVNARRNSVSDPLGSPSPKVPKIPVPKSVVQTSYQLQGTRPHIVTSGVEHCLLLSTSGRLHSLGRNRYGQCGVGNDRHVVEPTVLDGDWSSIVSLSSGQYHAGCVLKNGDVYTWGWGMYGQLGHGVRVGGADEWTPRKVEGLTEPMFSIQCGRAHTVLLSKSGRVYIAGGGTYGQLGTKTDIRKRFTFEPTSLVENCEVQPKIARIATRYFHTIAISEDNRIFEWGKNPQELKMKMFVMRRLRNAQADKNDENGKSKLPPLPTEIPKGFLGVSETLHMLDGQVVSAATGLSHSAVITETGNLFTWGKSLDYQLGHGGKVERQEPHQVFEPENIQWVDVQCGGLFTMATASDGKVFAWGRNDFAQCGMRSDKVPQPPRKLFFKAKEGVRRCVQLPDDSAFMATPNPVPDLICPIPKNKGDLADALDPIQLTDRMRKSDPSILEVASQHFQNKGELCKLASLPIALLHIMNGNVKGAIENVAEVAKRRGIKDEEPTGDLLSMCTLIWDVVANHEDCHTEEILSLAFTSLPITKRVKTNRQLRDLWPGVWSSSPTQSPLTPDEKGAMLASWNPPVQKKNNVEISGNILKSSSGRVRVWSDCGHVEQPNENGVCVECAREWSDRVRTAISDSI